jgi:hypothetical protein
MICKFTPEHYKECIKLGKELGFNFYTMHDYLKDKPKDKFIVMRHDVDLSLKHALRMAEIENSLDVKSTYFIRASKFLNPFSEKNAKIIKKISDMEHEIGLHYDSDVINIDDFKSFLLNLKKILEDVTGKKVYGASLHKIKKSGIKEIEKLNFVEDFLKELDLEYDAYSDIFLKKIKYISDSSYRWKEGCMCSHLKKENKLYILTHPIWWFSDATSLVSIIEELE